MMQESNNSNLGLTIIFRGFFGVLSVLLFIMSLYKIFYDSKYIHIEIISLIFMGIFSLIFWGVPINVLAGNWGGVQYSEKQEKVIQKQTETHQEQQCKQEATESPRRDSIIERIKQVRL